MLRVLLRPLLSFLLISASAAGCASPDSSEVSVEAADTTANKAKMVAQTHQEPHEYGGWYCPDNLTMFPPVNVRDLHNVPVVTDRLPTREETRSGKSLIYIDESKHPNANPLPMELPRLARYYNESTQKNELIVVIQAITVEGDSVVGFRYLNGGNGSAWLNEVEFLSDSEVESLPDTLFFNRELEFGCTPKAIWSVITNEKYARTLGGFFAEGAYVQSSWRRGEKVHIMIEDQEVATGNITASWEELYLQIDFNFDGVHYVEKYLMLEGENGSVKLMVAAGPFGPDAADLIAAWNKWFMKVVELAKEERC